MTIQFVFLATQITHHTNVHVHATAIALYVVNRRALYSTLCASTRECSLIDCRIVRLCVCCRAMPPSECVSSALSKVLPAPSVPK